MNNNLSRKALQDDQLMKKLGGHRLIKHLLLDHSGHHQVMEKQGYQQLPNKLQGHQLVKRKHDGFRRQHKKSDTYGNNYTIKRPDKCKLYPDIILVGFEKCGTITLWFYLGYHPEIFITGKSSTIPYFNPVERISYVTFTKHMPCTPGKKLKLEKISCSGSAMKVFEKIPNVKLLAIVREPVERAMSHYVHRVTERKEKPNTFDAIIKTSLDSMTNDNVTIKASELFKHSTYIDLLTPWLQTFGRDKIHVVDGDNFVKHPAFEMNKIEKFLNISTYFTEDHFVFNPEKKFYCLKEARCMDRSKGRPHPNMTQTTRKRLQAYFKPLNEKLFTALGQRLSWNY